MLGNLLPHVVMLMSVFHSAVRLSNGMVDMMNADALSYHPKQPT